jgi:polyisoprenoid-binding protein YceI
MRARSFTLFTALPLAATLIGCAALLLTGAHASAQTRTFRATSGSRMQFVSDAPLERITGVSTTVNGEISIDPANLSTATGRITVPISSIRTGLDLRDEHLRSDAWLDAGANPDAVLQITRVEGATSLTPNQVVRVTLHGTFSIHGHTHDVAIPAQVRLVPASAELAAQGITGDLIRAQASFTVSLPDYGVAVGALVRLKVSDTIQVNVTIRLTSG